MKHILLFGAGKSATVLIEYLKMLCVELSWKATVVDGSQALLNEKIKGDKNVTGVQANVENDEVRNDLVQEADIVISMLPPTLHYLVATSCLAHSKHLLTASYIDEKIQALEGQIKSGNLLFLCEMGLDPGIDHMSAMQLLNRIKSLGGTVTSFKSHCGGLVAPESDDNPWHYKVSWNPRNIVLAGKAGATFKEDNEIKHVPYEELFNTNNLIEIPGQVLWAWYPNRDSLSYIPLYKLEEAKTFIRTTLRHPEFCFGWKNMVDLKLTSEEVEYDTDGMTIATFFKLHFDKYGFAEWLTQMLTTRLTYAKDLMDNLMNLMEAEDELKEEGEKNDESIMLINEKGELDTMEVEDVKDKAAAAVALKMHEANLSLKQLFFLGLDSDELIKKGKCSAADILQHVIERRLALAKDDKDMVVMVHEIEYEIEGIASKVVSSLTVKGEDNSHTAMAKTVGLPLGIAAKLVLEGKITETGLHIPISAAIYEPVLKELEKQGISFNERIED
ncbi:MAG: saccharopine dehydrogenase NADP-binding domain-containing protein [Chitinophagaceae bacterium]|nr:saccharopine dehydrogenase NADP-binding domain-containing protein [Chitinophagaceae bacterium]